MNIFRKHPARNEYLHAGFHKCLTVYYKRIVETLGSIHGLQRIKVPRHELNHDSLRKLSKDRREPVVIFHVDEVTEDIRKEFFNGLKGSHFIRDPRDLVISGAYYHQVCKEKWCQLELNKIIPSGRVDTLVNDYSILEPAKDETYQSYIAKLAPEEAFIIELFRMSGLFSAMKNWNYSHPDIIEFRYEEIIGNEREAFRKLFKHYEFPRSWIKTGMELAEKFSLNTRAGRIKHVRSGKKAQWKTEFSPRMKELFKEQQGQLLIDLGYEKDFNW